MKSILTALIGILILVSCYKTDPEVISLLNQIKSQNDSLKIQITTLQKRTDSLQLVLKTTNTTVTNIDKKVDSLKTQLTLVLQQINTLNTQITLANTNIADLQVKIAELQKKCQELYDLLNNYLKSFPPNSLLDGLVAYYPFNGNAKDSTANSRNGTLNGDISSTEDRFGVAGKAYLMSSLNDNISVTNSTPLTFSNKISISSWFLKPEEYSYSSFFIVGNGTYYQNGFNLSMDQNDATCGPTKYRFAFNVGKGPNVYADVLKSQLKNWTHIVGVYDGTQVKIYINSQLINSASYSESISSPNGNLLLGDWDNPSTPSTPKRKIDDIRIYNRALTQSEIEYLYRN